LIIPDRAGYIIRTDYISLRLRGCALTRRVKNFAFVRKRVSNNHLESSSFGALLGTAVAGLTLYNSQTATYAQLMGNVADELTCRLSTPWISPDPLPSKRLAFIDGRIYFPTSKHFYYAAQALDIELIILDRPGHYLQRPEGADAELRKAFIELDLTRDADLPQRIADAVRSYEEPIDAVVTICDPLLPFVARANDILGCPTNPPQAFEVAIDKHKTRLLDEETDQALRISSVGELETHLQSNQVSPLRYPLIIKPCNGNGSEGVVKVATEAELLEEAERSFSRTPIGLQQQSDLVIETYVDGPEVDVNIVLWNNKVVFCEVTDDFPSTSDHVIIQGALPTLNFLETQNVLPSRLPLAEQHMLQTQIHALVAKAGFHFGLLHCEARVKHSRAYYANSKSGVLDLQSHGDQVVAEPRTFLIEINARTPGYIAAAATHVTYGIDLFAMVLLSAARDEQRLNSLAKPFDFSHRDPALRRTQFHASILFIHPAFDDGGVLLSDLMEVRSMLIGNRPDLFGEETIPEWQPHFSKGDNVPGPASGELYWLLDCVVTCTEGREKLLERCEEVRRALAETIRMARVDVEANS
ncbi:hypothetical protein BKA63DRAFT_413056, partial [Paraphoma chrysanthemicola]